MKNLLTNIINHWQIEGRGTHKMTWSIPIHYIIKDLRTDKYVYEEGSKHGAYKRFDTVKEALEWCMTKEMEG
jgi:hypothetical protein